MPACWLPRSGSRLAVSLAAVCAIGFLSMAVEAATPRVHAIAGARIVVAPGQVIERGNVVMRDGVIRAVGANVAIPADARVWPGDSLTVYAGMIDAFTSITEADAPSSGAGRGPRPGAQETPAPRGAVHELASVRPENRTVHLLPMGKDQTEALRAAGFAAVHLAPKQGLFRGQTAVVALGDGAVNEVVLRADAGQVIALEPVAVGYPGSLMGAVTVTRQALFDAKWYADVHALYARSPAGRERPAENLAWAALQPLIAGRQQAWFVTDGMLEGLRAAAIARETGIGAVVVSAGDEYKRARAFATAGLPLVVPVNFPEAPVIEGAAGALEVSTEELRHWHNAAGNPAALARQGVVFALTANGLKDVKKFRAQVAAAIEGGLSPDAALAAVTTTPARLLGLADRMGSVAVGKLAHLTVTRGPLFSDKGKVVAVWVSGRHYDTAGEGAIAGNWSLPGGARLLVNAEKDTTVKLVTGADTVAAREVLYQGNRLSFATPAAEHFTLRLQSEVLRGTRQTGGQAAQAVIGVRAAEEKKDGKGGADAEKKKGEPIDTPAVMGNTEAWRMDAPAAPAVLLVRNATLWTAGPQGTFVGDLLVRGGKIAAVGRGMTAPANAVVVDATGKHVAPGILDEHSHSAIIGNVNECTNSITCEVRIQDVINSESSQIYRQLAGGTTIMHLLHGSCNAIGGQCAVIKNKWGAPPDELLFGAAPPTVKFALGENPKRANFQIPGNPNRYPATRAGVEQVIREGFQRAQDYRAAHAEWKSGRRPYPPRRDLQLEALQEIIEERRLIHAHSYRQDEMLMLLRLAEDFGFRVNTLTHMQEAYKVADEIAAHGASTMGFSDWWGYKYEVIDGIPQNGYILWDRGVNVGFNSDDSELARRLNVEAAKAVKYGGVPPEEAIKFVTLNPAKSLKIDQRVGSLEVGKDADFAIWSGSPLSPVSACEQTWIEGRKYFDRAADLAGREALARERDALIARARDAKKEGGGADGGRRWPPRYLMDADVSGSDCQGDEAPFRSATTTTEVER